jgi:hypothetical protein
MMIIASIVVLTSIVMSLDPIKDNLQVFGESTSVLLPQPQEQSGNKSSIQVFTDSLRVLVSKSNELTSKYQQELGKWTTKENDNMTMVTITESYLSLFEELENEATDLVVPNGQENIKDSFIKSVNSEAASYEHFKNYLITGNKTEDELSIDDLSLAFQYEQVYSGFLLKNR